MMRFLFSCFILISIFSCSRDLYLKKANELCHKNIIVDGHVDLPYRLQIKNFRLEKQYIGIPIKSKEGDFDFRRAKKGGLTSPFMSIYISARLEGKEAQERADSLISMVYWIAGNNNNYFELAKTPDDVERIFKLGKIALPLGMENGSPILALEDLEKYKKKGISYITLTHSKANQICDSSYDSLRKYNGLSDYGYQVVNRMNELGIMIDVSHISDSSFMDVIKVTKVPVIASHSSARKFTPNWERNMSDDLIKAMKFNGGVIMVNFGTTFLDGDIAKVNHNNDKILEDELKRLGLKDDSEEGKKFIKVFKKKNPNVYSDVQRVADHIDHIVALAGVDHVGFGSDFDGVGDSLPTGLKDVADYPNLVAELLRRGYSVEDISKICYKNLFRVWKKVIDYSKIKS